MGPETTTPPPSVAGRTPLREKILHNRHGGDPPARHLPESEPVRVQSLAMAGRGCSGPQHHRTDAHAVSGSVELRPSCTCRLSDSCQTAHHGPGAARISPQIDPPALGHRVPCRSSTAWRARCFPRERPWLRSSCSRCRTHSATTRRSSSNTRPTSSSHWVFFCSPSGSRRPRRR